MKIKIVLTSASVTLFTLAMAQPGSAQSTTDNKITIESNQSKRSRNANEYDQTAKMGMYYAVMCELSSADGQTTRARDYAEQAVLLLQNPSDDFEFYAKGVAYAELANYDMAIVSFDNAIQHDPQKIIAYIRRGRVYSQKGNFDRALADFDKAIQLEATKSVDVEQSKSSFDKATPDIHQLMQRDPRPWFNYFRPADAYLDRGKTYLQKDDHDRALADFTQAIQLDPERANAYNLRGVAYATKGDLDRAIADFDKAIQLKPLLKNAHYNRGLAFSRKGDEARARVDFEMEKQLYPGYKASDDNKNGSVLNGRAVRLAKPEYPKAARKAHASGLVVVRVLIDEQGNVIEAQAISGHALLQDVCVEAAKNSLFTPTLLSGMPVKVTGVVHYNFIGR